MKKRYFILGCAVIVIISFTTYKGYSQTLSGPSDATSAAPASISEVNKIIVSGQTISLNGPQDESKVDFSTYNWYKLDLKSNKNLTSVKTKKYTEAPTAPGYYNYQLVTENSNGCSSLESDVYRVYVLPALNIAVTASEYSICTGIGSAKLTATTSSKNQKLIYQWYRDGVKINGATGDSFDVSGEVKQAKIVFTVSASFALNPGAIVSASKEITVIPQATKPMITAN